MAKKKEIIKNMNKNKKSASVEEVDIKGFIIVVIVILIVVGAVYGLTVLAQHKGLFDLRYTKPTVPEAVISYDYIQAGTIFNRVESDYYVMIADFDSKDSVYLNSIGSSYEDKEGSIKMYLVDLSDGLNKAIIGETSTPNVQNAADLKVSTHTLIRVTNGRNVRFVEGDENIKTELGV